MLGPFGDHHDASGLISYSPMLSAISHRTSADELSAPMSKPRDENEASPVSAVCGGTKAVDA
jgi:hypothetical protein